MLEEGLGYTYPAEPGQSTLLHTFDLTYGEGNLYDTDDNWKTRYAL